MSGFVLYFTDSRVCKHLRSQESIPGFQIGLSYRLARLGIDWVAP